MLLRRKLIYGLQCASSPAKIIIFSSFHRFSTSLQSGEAVTKIHFAVQYLIKSCGLPAEKAIAVSKYIPHLKSPSGPDAVLGFLKQHGVSNADIRSGLSIDPRFLCYGVDNHIKVKVKELEEIGFSPSHVAQLISISPGTLRCRNLHQNLKFLMPVLGSVDMLLKVMKRNRYLLTTNVDKVIRPNASFLKEHCHLSICEILQHSTFNARLVTFSPNVVKDIVQRVEGLGIPRNSGYFKYALSVVSGLSQSRLDAKVNHLKSLGWSAEEVFSMIRKQPRVLAYSEDKIHRILDFLTREVGLELSACNPYIFAHSLEQRLIPRHYVLSALKSKNLPEGSRSFYSAVAATEKKFLEKFVLPFEEIIPGISASYAAACNGKVSAKNKN